MSLIGFRYFDSNDPGAVGAGKEWYNTTTGNLYIRNSTDTAWVLIGNSDTASLGNLPASGGPVTGAITGVSGWAPLDSPDFTTIAKLNGIDLATTTDLANTQTALINLIDARVASAIASSTSGTSGVNSSIAKTRGSGSANTGTTFTIPLPTYPGSGETADESDCVWMVAMTGIGLDDYTSGASYAWQVYLSQTSNRNYSIVRAGGKREYTVNYEWIIIGVKP